MKTKKKILTLLSAVVLTATLLTCFTLFSGAESVTPEMKIGYCNLSFADNIRIKYAVNSNVDNVELLVWRSPKADYIYGTHDDVLTNCYTEKIGGVPHYIFDFDGFSAKNMTDYVYTRAHVKVGDIDYYSDVNKYSILQYAHNMIAKSSDQKLIKLLTQMLEYGAAVQEYRGYKTDRLSTASWYSVKLTEGSLPDGMREGLYLNGESITITAPEADADGGTFEGWYDGNNTKISSNATAIITVSGNETYSPKYNSVTYSTGFDFISNGDGTCYVSGIGTSTDTEIIVPHTSPAGDTVIGIGKDAFRGYTGLTSITIPNSVTNIGYMAFCDCTRLANIVVEDGNDVYHSIDNCLIETKTKTLVLGCKSSVIPSDGSVKSIGKSAFWGCSSLTRITIPNSVTGIGDYAFGNCTSLVDITIPDSVMTIGDSAFYGCTSLTSITIPDHVTNISGVFSGCTSLTNIIIGNGIKSIGDSVFYNCLSIASITLPDSVTNIGDYSFRYCTGLTSIVIPDGVASIGESAFEGCWNLAKVYYGGTADQWTSISIDSYNSKLTGATRYYYSETKQTNGGNYWHYVDGVVTEW